MDGVGELLAGKPNDCSRGCPTGCARRGAVAQIASVLCDEQVGVPTWQERNWLRRRRSDVGAAATGLTGSAFVWITCSAPIASAR